MGNPWVRRQLQKSHPRVSARVRATNNATQKKVCNSKWPEIFWLHCCRLARIGGPEASRAIYTTSPAPHSGGRTLKCVEQNGCMRLYGTPSVHAMAAVVAQHMLDEGFQSANTQRCHRCGAGETKSQLMCRPSERGPDR